MRMAAIYARVSSEQQREENTIASQTASLIEFSRRHDLEVPGEWVFEDEGYSGATLERLGARARSRRGRTDPGCARLRAGPLEPEVRVPDPADRRVCPPRSRHAVCEGAARRQRGRSTPGAVPGHDRRI